MQNINSDLFDAVFGYSYDTVFLIRLKFFIDFKVKCFENNRPPHLYIEYVFDYISVPCETEIT